MYIADEEGVLEAALGFPWVRLGVANGRVGL